MEYPGNLFVVAAPSWRRQVQPGQGLDGTRLARQTIDLAHHPRAAGQEKDGREYFFVSAAEFDAMIKADGFVEWAEVHGHRYGTSRQAIAQLMDQGSDVVLEIDFQGALSIKRTFDNAVTIFILPPSWDELRARLERRGEDASRDHRPAPAQCGHRNGAGPPL